MYNMSISRSWLYPPIVCRSHFSSDNEDAPLDPACDQWAWPLTMSPEPAIIRCLLCGLGTLESSLELHLQYNHLIYQELLHKVWTNSWSHNWRKCQFIINHVVATIQAPLSSSQQENCHGRNWGMRGICYFHSESFEEFQFSRILWMTKRSFKMLQCLLLAPLNINELCQNPREEK